MSSYATDLKRIFLAPRSIAVIGASEKLGVGRAIFSNIINGYKGKIFIPVTPSNPTVFGINSYKSVLDVQDDISRRGCNSKYNYTCCYRNGQETNQRHDCCLGQIQGSKRGWSKSRKRSGGNR